MYGYMVNIYIVSNSRHSMHHITNAATIVVITWPDLQTRITGSAAIFLLLPINWEFGSVFVWSYPLSCIFMTFDGCCIKANPQKCIDISWVLCWLFSADIQYFVSYSHKTWTLIWVMSGRNERWFMYLYSATSHSTICGVQRQYLDW